MFHCGLNRFRSPSQLYAAFFFKAIYIYFLYFFICADLRKSRSCGWACGQRHKGNAHASFWAQIRRWHKGEKNWAVFEVWNCRCLKLMRKVNNGLFHNCDKYREDKVCNIFYKWPGFSESFTDLSQATLMFITSAWFVSSLSWNYFSIVLLCLKCVVFLTSVLFMFVQFVRNIFLLNKYSIKFTYINMF